MLRQPNTATITLAQSILTAGGGVSAIEGTPLATLVEASLPLETYGVTVTNEGIQGGNIGITNVETAIHRSVAYANANAFSHQSLHTDIMEDSVSRYSTVVNKNIALARSIVNPLVSKIIESVTKEADLKAEAKKTIEIQRINLTGIWNSNILTTLIGSYVPSGYNAPTNTKLYPSFENINISTLLEHISGRFYNAVNDWMERGGLTHIEFVWNNYFAKNDNIAIKPIGYDLVGRERALALFILALALNNGGNSIYDVEISASDFSQRIEGQLYYSAAIIDDAIRTFDDEVKEGNVVAAYPTAGLDVSVAPIIYVNGVNYDKWLEVGGSPEVLMGAYLADKPVHSSILTNNSETYLTKWSNHLARVNMTNESNRLSNIKTALKKFLGDEIENLGDEFGAPVNEMYTTMVAGVDKLGIYHLDNLYCFVRDIICDAMYPKTEAKKILCLIDDYSAKYPQLPPRELALLATTYLVSEWVAKMMLIKKAR